MRNLVALAVFALIAQPIVNATPSSARGNNGATDQTKEIFRWSGKVGSAQTLWLRNTNGGIVAEPSTGAEVEIVAIARWRKSDPDKVSVVAKTSSSGVTVCALWPAGKSLCGVDGAYGQSDTEESDVDITLQVKLPAGVRVDASTVNGAVVIRGAAGPLQVRTVNGAIEANAVAGAADLQTVNGQIRVKAAAGAVKAETVNGQIDVTVGGGSGDLSLVTQNGEVRVKAPTSMSADVEADVQNGTIRIAGTRYDTQARVRLGNGGRKLRAHSLNGGIRIDLE